ncbi:MAG TPA: site-specific integrase [Clostridiaceae bacterium]|nr:site-specific integrase [Clostridiaceae bacterium]
MASIEWRSDNSFRVTVSCGYDSEGKKITKKKSFKLDEGLTPKQAEKEAQKLATLFEEQVQKGTYLDGNKLTFAEFIQIWLEKYAEAELEPKTVDEYKKLLKRVIPALGDIKLAKLQPTQLIDFYDNLRENGIREDTIYRALPELKAFIEQHNLAMDSIATEAGITTRTVKSILNGNSTNKAKEICEVLKIKLNTFFVPVGEVKPLSGNTINHYHKLISSMLTNAVQWQLILLNPAERVEPPKIDKKEASYYDEDTLEKMLVLLENEPLKYRAMVSLTLYMGLRKGELMGLEWPDIDFENKKLRIRQASQYVSSSGTITKKPKNKTSIRTITLPDVAVDMLRKYKAQQNEERLEMGDLWENSDRLFVQFNGVPMHPDSISKWFNKFIRRNNLPKLNFHGLRHSNASLLIAENVDVRTIAGRLGHAKPSTTTDIYGHLLKRPDQEAAEKLNKRFNKKSKDGKTKQA